MTCCPSTCCSQPQPQADRAEQMAVGGGEGNQEAQKGKVNLAGHLGRALAFSEQSLLGGGDWGWGSAGIRS